MDTGSEYYREGSRALASAVKEQPLGSLLVAGAVGVLLALLLNRPPRRYDRSKRAGQPIKPRPHHA